MIVAGFGFRSEASAQSLLDALAQTGGAPTALATAADKAEAQAFDDLAHALGLPVYRVAAAELAAQSTLTQSDASQNARGTGSVAEAAALAAAGPKGRLLGPRTFSSDRMASCALAEIPT